MQVIKPNQALSYVPKHLRIATTEEELKNIWEFRRQCFSIYPAVKNFENDIHDEGACVLYGKSHLGHITSTCRLVFDSSSGLPADQLLKPEIDKLRQEGLRIAESSKLASTIEDMNTIARYFFTYYEIAVSQGVDSIVFIVWDKYISAYRRYVDAQILVRDIGFSYGTENTFSLLECRIKEAAPTIIKKCGGKL